MWSNWENMTQFSIRKDVFKGLRCHWSTSKLLKVHSLQITWENVTLFCYVSPKMWVIWGKGS